MKVGSLFSGIGGFDLGFERAGMTVSWQVEIDQFCRLVLERHFPDAERFADVQDVGKHNLADVDLLCGGFPCQDLSRASKHGHGLAGARSGLWAEYARIIRELGPSYVVVENVPTLLSIGRDWIEPPLGRILADLSELGYDAEWSVLSAAEFGAPHIRKRVWIVAYPRGERRERVGADGETEQQKRPQLAGRDSASAWLPVSEPGLCGVADGFPGRVDRTAAAGNALVPQIAEWIGARIMEFEATHVVC